MILVPHDIGRREELAANVMSNLDREMSEILQNRALPSDAKAILYNQCPAGDADNAKLEVSQMKLLIRKVEVLDSVGLALEKTILKIPAKSFLERAHLKKKTVTDTVRGEIVHHAQSSQQSTKTRDTREAQPSRNSRGTEGDCHAVP
uniref:Uncharacterized protein n=1 Tax=Romanomermis culicivorax TaxID=13658 RepID=A0A915IKJ9_ROMCU